MVKLLKFTAFLIVLSIYNQTIHAKFEKEVELIDKGFCEEALLENDKTAEEEKKTWYLKGPFANKYSPEIFEQYRLNRRITILDNNCKRKKEALDLALISLEREKKHSKFPLKELEKLQITKFQMVKNLADAHARVAGLYNDLGNLDLAIKYEEKAIKIYELSLIHI